MLSDLRGGPGEAAFAAFRRDMVAEVAAMAKEVGPALEGSPALSQAVLDALGRESSDAVAVRQLRQRGRDTELLAASSDHAASAAWLNRLAALKGVKDSDLSDVRRATGATEASSAFEIKAHLKWDGPPEKKRAQAEAHQNTRGKQ